MLAYRAVEDGDGRGSSSCSTRIPTWSGSAGRTATTCSGWRATSSSCGCCSSAAPTRTAATTTAGRSSTRPGYSNRPELAQLMLDAGGRLDLSARGDGGTPLIAALFWGHREVVALLGLEPGNLRVAAGLGRPELIDELAGTPRGGSAPGLLPAARRLPRLAAVRRSAGGARRGARLGREGRPGRGAASCSSGSERASRPIPTAAPPLIWAAANGRVGSIRKLVELGADPNQRATFGGPDHGEGVTALHLAAQSGRARRRRGAARARRRPDARATRCTTARRRAGPTSAGTQSSQRVYATSSAD